MPFSIVITGIFTGTLAAAFAISLDSGAMWAMLSYSMSGALALFGAGLIISIRRNLWPRKGWWFMSRRTGWHARLDQMARQSGGAAQVGLFTAVKRNPQVRM
ncbi:hypothetical protein MUY35_12895 [Aliiroseovarius sp. S1339]|uniref:hypothetical protein n=1 Tax=Aliiroseovarius sp. S1339 TaxID=2936990 RepID=UPI0020BD59C0|nr:hypothetical protein [Aliiroseovarius sp. S1339]MCK8464747.1 hypothetical protein [Aliiroseovarius sp. S1339]